MQETRFDTSIVKITCAQTVIALQTIRTTITHFLKVNILKQRASARLEITLQKTHRGEKGEVKVRRDQEIVDSLTLTQIQWASFNLLTFDASVPFISIKSHLKHVLTPSPEDGRGQK